MEIFKKFNDSFTDCMMGEQMKSQFPDFGSILLIDVGIVSPVATITAIAITVVSTSSVTAAVFTIVTVLISY